MKLRDKALFLETQKLKGKPMLYKQEKPRCPFCDVEGLRTSGGLLKEGKDMLWIKNAFPVLKDTYQTLIIESLSCEQNLSNYSKEHLEELFNFAFQCRQEMLQTGEYNDAILFKNHNYKSGGSIPHAHFQIVGLKNQKYDLTEIVQSVSGPIVFENKTIKITVSQVPITEFYEFNITWEKGQPLTENVYWIQNIVQYVLNFKNQKYDSFNLAYYETEEKSILKIIPRGVSSIFVLGYNLHQAPDDVEQIAEELKNFSLKNGLPIKTGDEE